MAQFLQSDDFQHEVCWGLHFAWKTKSKLLSESDRAPKFREAVSYADTREQKRKALHIGAILQHKLQLYIYFQAKHNNRSKFAIGRMDTQLKQVTKFLFLVFLVLS